MGREMVYILPFKYINIKNLITIIGHLETAFFCLKALGGIHKLNLNLKLFDELKSKYPTKIFHTCGTTYLALS